MSKSRLMLGSIVAAMKITAYLVVVFALFGANPWQCLGLAVFTFSGSLLAFPFLYLFTRSLRVN